MSHETTTLAEWASYGWRMGLLCLGCRVSFGSLTSADILDRFGANLLATVGDLCDRAKCPECGHVGASCMGMADVAPETQVSEVQAKINAWIARDLYLRRELAARGLPLEVADFAWARTEAFGRQHPHWEPRSAALPGYPLSAAGILALGPGDPRRP